MLVAEKTMAEWMKTIKDAIIGYYCTFSKPVYHTNSGNGLPCPVEFVRYLFRYFPKIPAIMPVYGDCCTTDCSARLVLQSIQRKMQQLFKNLY